jgi:hypothetical protein
MYPVFRKRLLLQCPQFYFSVACSYLTQRPSNVTGDEWSQRDWGTICMGTSSVSNGIAGLYWSYMCCIQTIFCHCLFIFDTEASYHMSPVINQVKWLKKHIYGYQQFVKWVLLVYNDHTLCPVFRKGHCCNAQNYFAIACSYLSQWPSFVTGN